MVAVSAMFTTMFTIIHSEDDGDDGLDDDENGGFLNDPRPFQNFGQVRVPSMPFGRNVRAAQDMRGRE